MKKFPAVLTGLLFLGMAAWPIPAGAQAPGDPDRLKIRKVLAGLQKAERGYQHKKKEFNHVRNELQTRILGRMDRGQLQEVLQIDQRQMVTYRESARNLIRFLRLRWQELTPQEQDSVNMAPDVFL